jgi:hypothetical protein
MKKTEELDVCKLQNKTSVYNKRNSLLKCASLSEEICIEVIQRPKRFVYVKQREVQFTCKFYLLSYTQRSSLRRRVFECDVNYTPTKLLSCYKEQFKCRFIYGHQKNYTSTGKSG